MFSSYKLLQEAFDVSVSLSFENFQQGPKDMLDAVICALTVLEFKNGRGCEVGGGDGLGAIVLPRPIPNQISEVSIWSGIQLE